MDAMIVVDMQAGLLAEPPKHALDGVIDRINRLAAMLRARAAKIIRIRHCGRGDEFAHNRVWNNLITNRSVRVQGPPSCLRRA